MESSYYFLYCIYEHGPKEGYDQDWIPVSSLSSSLTMSTSYSLIDDVGSKDTSCSLMMEHSTSCSVSSDLLVDCLEDNAYHSSKNECLENLDNCNFLLDGTFQLINCPRW